MTFYWPNMLWLAGILPVLILSYIWLLRRKNKAALRFASLGIVKEAMTPGRRFRRHIPPILMFVSVAVLVFAMARPAAVVTLPSNQAIIMLSMDVSGSMRANDINPTRISAAQAAARDFVAVQPKTAKVGIVAFSSAAMLVQAPTTNHDELNAAIEHLRVDRFTAVGSGLMVALHAVFPDVNADMFTAGRNAFRRCYGYGCGDSNSNGKPLGEGKGEEEQKPPPPVQAGSYKNAVIVLMSDGQTNMGADPIEAARIAANHGIRVFTVGFGSDQGGNVDFEGRTVHVRLDEETLKSIADITRGTYYKAGSESELKKVYKTLSTQFVMEREKTEITAIVTAIAALFAVLAGVLSILWFGRFA